MRTDTIKRTVFFIAISAVITLLSNSCLPKDEKSKEIVLKNIKGNERVDFEILLPEYGTIFEPIITIKYTNKKTDSRLKFKYRLVSNIGLIKSEVVDVVIEKENSYLKNILYKEVSIKLGRFVSPLAGVYKLEIYDINSDNSIVAIALEKNISTK